MDARARGEKLAQEGIVDEGAGEADALVEADEMGRGVDMRAVAGRLGDGAQIGHGRALAVGPRDMDDRRQAVLRIAEIGEQPLDAVEREVDRLGVERGQAVENALR